jgi:hypothetical protein
MISHKNVIANVLQMRTFEDPWRKTLIQPGNQSAYTENVLGLVSLTNVICGISTDKVDSYLSTTSTLWLSSLIWVRTAVMV